MEAARWARAQAVFHQAVALPAAARQDWVREQTNDDLALQSLVLSLLNQDDRTDDRTVSDAVSRAAADAIDAARGGLDGRLLGPWRILRHLADGGMGAVYLAERADGHFEQQAAIKLLNPALISPGARERLAVERQILARLQHRHIARLLDGGTTPEGAPYLVMEYVDGVPIDTYCETHRLGSAERLRLLQQVCAAVEHAHQNLIVHRDLKPGNILVDAEGLPKLLDFGIAKLMDEGAAELTRADQRLLTPAHASPEQLRGEPITTATDVYALGVLMYQLLTRRRPFPRDPATAGHAAQLAREILELEPRRPSAALSGDAASLARRRRELRGDLDNIVLKALAKDPQRRYASVRALADDIEHHLQHRPVSAHADRWSYRLAKALRRHRLAVGIVGVALLAVATLTGFYTWQLRAQRDLAERERATAEQVTAFMTSLFESANPALTSNADRPVREVVDDAAQRIDGALAGQPALQVRLLRILGRVYRMLGLTERSTDLMQHAAQIGASMDPREFPDIGQIQLDVSNSLLQAGRIQASLDWAERSRASWIRSQGAASFEAVEASIAVATRMARLGRLDEVLALLDSVAPDLAQLPDPLDRRYLAAVADFSRARVALLRGRGDEAAALLARSAEGHRVVAEADQSVGYDHQVLTALAWRARALGSAGRLDENVAQCEEVLQAQHRDLPDGHLFVEQARSRLARAWLERGDVARAVALAQQALAVWPAGDDTAGLAESVLAEALWLQGDLAGAEQHARRDLALTTARRPAVLTPFGSSALARSYAVLGGILVDQGHADEGLRLIDTALLTLRSAHGGRLPPAADGARAARLLALLSLGRAGDPGALTTAGEPVADGAPHPTDTAAWRLAQVEQAVAQGDAAGAAAALTTARAAVGRLQPVPARLQAWLQGSALAVTALGGRPEDVAAWRAWAAPALARRPASDRLRAIWGRRLRETPGGTVAEAVSR